MYHVFLHGVRHPVEISLIKYLKFCLNFTSIFSKRQFFSRKNKDFAMSPEWPLLFKTYAMAFDPRRIFLGMCWSFMLALVLDICALHFVSLHLWEMENLEPLAKLWHGPSQVWIWHGIGLLLWIYLSWVFLGGAIHRSAAVELACTKRISMFHALQYSLQNYGRFCAGPLLLLSCFAFITGLLTFLGWAIEKIQHALGISLTLVFSLLFSAVGFLMLAILLTLFLGLSLMLSAIAMDRLDQYDAVSRSMTYFFHCFWRFAIYHLIAAVHAIFVIAVSSILFLASVWLTQWAMSLGCYENIFIFSKELFYFIFWIISGFCIAYYVSIKTTIYALLRQSLENAPISKYCVGSEENAATLTKQASEESHVVEKKD